MGVGVEEDTALWSLRRLKSGGGVLSMLVSVGTALIVYREGWGSVIELSLRWDAYESSSLWYSGDRGRSSGMESISVDGRDRSSSGVAGWWSVGWWLSLGRG